MSVSSVFPCFVLLLLFLGVGWLILRVSPFYRGEIEAGGGPGGSRLESLDGLRCYLALGVFFHHGIINYYVITTKIWDSPTSSFYRLLGEGSVVLFFLITGFLFWTKAIRGRGRVAPVVLLRGRLLRIAPMYLAVSISIYAFIVVLSRFRFQNTPVEVARALISLLGLGFFRLQPLNGISPLEMYAGVFWTLRYEWLFYLALPLMAIGATPRRFAMMALAYLALGYWARGDRNYIFGSMFVVAMAVAHSRAAFGPIRLASAPWVGMASLAVLIALPFVTPGAYRLKVVPVLGLVFWAIVHGNTWLGLLTIPSARVLGTISYSLYVTHGFVLYLGRKILVRALGSSPPDPLVYWAFLAVAGLVTIGVSCLSYRYVEVPFIQLAHRLNRARSQGAGVKSTPRV